MRERSVDELDRLDSPIVIDVREPEEYAPAHVPGAKNVPLGQLRQHLDLLAGRGEIHLICQSGRRSAQATEALSTAGIDAVNITGGTTAWIEAGKPTEREA